MQYGYKSNTQIRLTSANRLSHRNTYIPLLTVGECYEVTFTPLMYDTNTFEAVRYYIITCDDGYAREFPLDYFITLEDYRDLQLEKLL